MLWDEVFELIRNGEWTKEQFEEWLNKKTESAYESGYDVGSDDGYDSGYDQGYWAATKD